MQYRRTLKKASGILSSVRKLGFISVWIIGGPIFLSQQLKVQQLLRLVIAKCLVNSSESASVYLAFQVSFGYTTIVVLVPSPFIGRLAELARCISCLF